ncbi:MAG: hypothetical protein EOM35_06390 [Negativicutes bacterium]|nr:hypothetical protein [Negativicutes bacterium]
MSGKDGVAQDGKYYEFRFAVNTSSTTAPTLAATLRNPAGWSKELPTKDDTQVMWMTTAQINPDNTLRSNWDTPVCISGERGPQGNTGPIGPPGIKGD